LFEGRPHLIQRVEREFIISRKSSTSVNQFSATNFREGESVKIDENLCEDANQANVVLYQ
jgi:hypothetical protein